MQLNYSTNVVIRQVNFIKHRKNDIVNTRKDTLERFLNQKTEHKIEKALDNSKPVNGSAVLSKSRRTYT